MNKNFESEIIDFIKNVRKYKTGHELNQYFDYLGSIRLKYKFAKSRLIKMKRGETCYKKKRLEEHGEGYIKTTWPDNYAILMEFDHCVISLRSLLEHLLQLINLAIPLGLSPRQKQNIPSVSIGAILVKMNGSERCQNNAVLNELKRNIQELRDQYWYDHLNELRVEQYHNKFIRPSLNEHRSQSRELSDVSLLIPCVKESRNHVDIATYCEDRIDDVENVLSTSLVLLMRYLSNED